MNKKLGITFILIIIAGMALPAMSSGDTITPVKNSPAVTWPCSAADIGTKRYLREGAVREMQTCDGVNWVPMGPRRSPQNVVPNVVPNCNPSLEGKQQYNSTLNHMEYCDGNNWLKIGCYESEDSCAGVEPGTQRFETSLQIMQYCNGTNWIDMSSVPGKPCCPENYVPVPKDSDGVTAWDFCVAKYHMKPKHSSSRNTVDGKSFGSDVGINYHPDSRPGHRPWGGIDYNSARAHCAALGDSYHLITNSEWMTIAKSIERNPANWSGGAVGDGHIPTGHSDGYCDGTGPLGCQSGQDYLAASTDDTQGCFGTNNNDCLDKGTEDFWQKRTFVLSNGKIIWDMAGNINSWVNMTWPVTPGGLFSYIDPGDGPGMSIYQVNDTRSMLTYPTMTPFLFFNEYQPSGNMRAFFPANDYTATTPWYDQLGFGTLRWENDTNAAVFRGGKFDEPRLLHSGTPDPDIFGRRFKQETHERRGGLYSAWMWFPGASHGDLGFRCSYDPP